MKDGYGISEGLTARILAQPELPAVIITADCGSSDNPRIARLKAAGIDADRLPIIMPCPGREFRQRRMRSSILAVRDCPYPDDTIAGCTTAWLLMSHVRNKLIDLGYPPPDSPKLARELDYVSLGTVADCVSIGTATNRAGSTTIALHHLTGLNAASGAPAHTCWIKKTAAFNELKTPELFKLARASTPSPGWRIPHAALKVSVCR